MDFSGFKKQCRYTTLVIMRRNLFASKKVSRSLPTTVAHTFAAKSVCLMMIAQISKTGLNDKDVDILREKRIEHRGGIIYVVRRGNLIPVYDREEAEQLVAELESVNGAIH